MNKDQWFKALPIEVRFIFLVLLANAVPAIIILMSIPTRTDDFFVWTVKPVINARLIGVMYANALILVGIGVFQPTWARVRIIMVVITLFSILATVLTFFYLKPFRAHPWFHLAFWLSMYFILFFGAPYVFVTQERRAGGRLPVHLPLNGMTRVVLGLLAVTSAIFSLALLFEVDRVNEVLPWTLPPLVGGLIGVLFATHTAAYLWALWDGDWLRIRPIIWQALPTALLFILLPLLHADDLRPDVDTNLVVYYVVAGVIALVSLGIIVSYRPAEQRLSQP